MAQTPEVNKAPNRLVTILVTDKSGRKLPMKIQRGELVRRVMASNVAKQTLNLVANHHMTEAGRRVTLDPQWGMIYADPSTDMRIIAPAQRGKTLYQLVKTFAQLTLGMSVGWVMPKENKLLELVHGKLAGTIKNTPLYTALQDMSDGNDTMRFKTFGAYGKVYFVTANSPDELTSFSADAMHIDERDFCNRNNLPMYPSRMNFSPFKLTDEISTPTVEGTRKTRVGQVGTDNIHTEFLLGDQYRYHTTCPFCKEVQILDWYENVVDVQKDEAGRICKYDLMDKEWSDGAAQDIRICCRKCKYPFDRTIPGTWTALNPGAAMRTYWVEALASHVGPTLAKMFRTFQLALGNPSKMEHFHNMDLGRPFAGGLYRFTPDLFERCVEAGHFMAHSGSEGPCTIGIDVNRPFLDIQISRWVGGRQVKVFVDKVMGDEEQIITLIKRYKVVGGVIDNDPELKLAVKIQDRAMAECGCYIIRCKYATHAQSQEVVISEQGETQGIDPPRLITVNKTAAVDSLYESMLFKSVVWFSEWQQVLDGALYAEFNNPVRKLTINEAGLERFIWEGTPDHQLHAAVYDLLAGRMMEMNLTRDLSEVMPIINVIQHRHGPVGPMNQAEAALFDNSVMIVRA